MGYFVFGSFLLLALSLVLSVLRVGPAAQFARVFRYASVIFTVAFFVRYFAEGDITKLSGNALTVQVINHLPQPLDFYIIKKKVDKGGHVSYITRHPGIIRPEFYRIDYLDMANSDEFWVAGYLGKKNIVYFSQHAVPNKNVDQIIEVQNYINQSLKLSAEAAKNVEGYHVSNIRLSVWATLDLLLLFLNIVIIFRREATKD